jgi:hypothetical protein
MTAILLSLLIGATDTAPPLASATPLTADRGTARTGPPLTQTWTLTHAGGPGTVTVTGVEASCGCAAPAVAAKSLRPGEITTLTLTVNTLTQPAGTQTWRATLRGRHTPDAGGEPTDFDMVFALKAGLVREVSVTPPALALSTATEATQRLTVTDVRGKPLKVLAAATGNPHVTARILPPVTANGVTAAAVEVRVTAAMPVGTTDETVTITTDDPACSELRVPLRVVKRDPAAVVPTPEVAEVHFAVNQEVASALVQLRSPARGTLRVESASCDDPAVTVRFAQSSGLVATLRISLDRARAGGAGSAVVRVKLAEPAGETVALPVQWTVPQ